MDQKSLSICWEWVCQAYCSSAGPTKHRCTFLLPHHGHSNASVHRAIPDESKRGQVFGLQCHRWTSLEKIGLSSQKKLMIPQFQIRFAARVNSVQWWKIHGKYCRRIVYGYGILQDTTFSERIPKILSTLVGSFQIHGHLPLCHFSSHSQQHQVAWIYIPLSCKMSTNPMTVGFKPVPVTWVCLKIG